MFCASVFTRGAVGDVPAASVGVVFVTVALVAVVVVAVVVAVTADVVFAIVG